MKRLGVLGLAYKPGTISTLGGAGRALVEALEPAIDMLVHDPQAELPTRPAGSRAAITDSVEQVLTECDVVVVTTPWPEYSPFLERSLGSELGPIVVDPYRQVERSWAKFSPSRLVQLGVSGE